MIRRFQGDSWFSLGRGNEGDLLGRLGVDRDGNLRDGMEVARTGRVLRELTEKGTFGGWVFLHLKVFRILANLAIRYENWNS